MSMPARSCMPMTNRTASSMRRCQSASCSPVREPTFSKSFTYCGRGMLPITVVGNNGSGWDMMSVLPFKSGSVSVLKSRDSRFGDCSVAAAEVSPAHVERGIVSDGELRGQFFVEVDAEARMVVGVVIAVLQFGAAGEDVLFRLREDARLLHAKVGRGEIEMHVRRMADRRDIARTVPS